MGFSLMNKAAMTALFAVVGGAVEQPASGFLSQAPQDLPLVSCGGHQADSCSSCTQGGKGPGWCNGDCKWNWKASECVAKAPPEYLEVKYRGDAQLPEDTKEAFGLYVRHKNKFVWKKADGAVNYLFHTEHGWMISDKLTKEAHAPFIFSRSSTEFPNGATIWHYWDGSDFVHDNMLEIARRDSIPTSTPTNSTRTIAAVALFCVMLLICITRFCYERSRKNLCSTSGTWSSRSRQWNQENSKPSKVDTEIKVGSLEIRMNRRKQFGFQCV